MLPLLIEHAIFNLDHPPDEITISHLLDEVEQVGLLITNYVNYDHAIVISFARNSDCPISGEIRVDRIRRLFDVSAFLDHSVVLPASGDWPLIIDYLQQLVAQ